MSATNGAEGGGPVVVHLQPDGVDTSCSDRERLDGGTGAIASDVTRTDRHRRHVERGTNTITFNVGSSTVTLSYGIVNDAAVEGDETLVVHAGRRQPATPSARRRAPRGTIVDNDFALPAVTVTATNGVEGGAAVTVSVSRTGSTASTLTVTTTRTGTWSDDLPLTPAVTGGTGTPVPNRHVQRRRRPGRAHVRRRR